MNADIARRTILIGAFIVALFVIHNAWPTTVSPPLSPSPSFAGVGVATEDADVLFTASPDGKTIYMWQFFSSKPPKYLGSAEAVLSQ